MHSSQFEYFDMFVHIYIIQLSTAVFIFSFMANELKFSADDY